MTAARWWLAAVFGPDDYLPARRYLYFMPGVLALAYLLLRKALG